MGKEETEIQRQIMDYLDAKGIYYVRPQAGGYRGGMNLKCNGGAPDIVLCNSQRVTDGVHVVVIEIGLFVGIEIKSADGKQRLSQKTAQERIERCGGRYLIVRSVDDLVKAGI